MKRAIFSLIFLTLVINILAQTQKGVVRTIGRNNHPGSGIKDVVISIENIKNERDSILQEKEVISDSLGKFEVVLHGYKEGQGFILKNVIKPGFDLKNYGDIGRHPFSSTEVFPVYMFSIKEKKEEERRVLDRYQNKRDSLFRAKEDSLIEALNDSRLEITTYRKIIDKMTKDFENTDQLYRLLADRYATINYDEMSDWEKQIVSFMEQGDFEVADSIVDIVGIDVLFEEAMESQRHNVTAENLYNLSIKDAMEKTHVAIEALYVKYTKFIMETNFFYATECMEKIVALDTTSIEHLLEASECLSIIGNYSKAKEYSNKAREMSLSPTMQSKAFQLLGVATMGLHDYSKAKNYFLSAVDTYDDDHSFSYLDSCNISSSLFLYAICETELGHLDSIEFPFSLGLLFIPKSEIDSDVYAYAWLSCLEALIVHGYFDEVEQMCLSLLNEIDNSNESDVVEIRILIELYYLHALNRQNRIDKAIQYADEMVSMLSTLPEFSYIKRNKNIMFNIYSAVSTAFSYRLETRNKAYALMDSVQMIYKTDEVQDVLSYTLYLNQMGHLLYRDEKYNKAIECFREALQAISDNGKENLLMESMLYYNIAQNMVEINELDSALLYHQKALQIREGMTQDAFYNKVESYDGLGNVYELKKQYILAHKYYLKAGLAQQEIGGFSDLNSIKYMKKSYELLNKADFDASSEKENNCFNQFSTDYAFVFVKVDDDSCLTCPKLLYVFELGDWTIKSKMNPFRNEWVKYQKHNNGQQIVLFDGKDFVKPNEINLLEYNLTIVPTKEKQRLLKQYNKFTKKRK